LTGDLLSTRSDQSKARRQLLQVWLDGFRAASKCERCGLNHAAALDFHHRDPIEKDIDVTKAIRNRWSLERMKAEIAKCSVLCASCHRIVHYEIRTTQSAA
jgi:hypothetical protein